jgi:hypothetical protein
MKYRLHQEPTDNSFCGHRMPLRLQFTEEPGSITAAGPLRIGRETFVLIRRKPFKHPFQEDAVSIGRDVAVNPVVAP